MRKYPPSCSAATLAWSAGAALALGLSAGCTPVQTRAANKAAEAQADLEAGRVTQAGIAIRQALALRDDVADYWLTEAHIDIRQENRAAAFDDYEYVNQLDHGNLEALQALCQLGLTQGPADRVDSYADQLLVLSPDAAPALTAKGNVALNAGDTDQAAVFADRVLAKDPQNIAALTLKARVMIARDKFADAAALIEQTPDSSLSEVGKLKLLQEIYERGNDRASYETTVKRLAQVAPDDSDLQLNYADTLYQAGQNEAARGVIDRVMRSHSGDFHIAALVLNLWMKAGSLALDPARMVADAAGLSPLMKADYAQFANETGRPDIAIAILQGADRGDPTAANSNAKAAFAYALGITGHAAQALTQLNTILDDAHDPNQPVALLARARLLAAAHDYPPAVRDARLAVANDRDDPTKYLALADILRASGSADLSDSALREGVRAIPDSVRLAVRLAAVLAARGDRDQAVAVARELSRAAPMDPRAGQLLQTYGGLGTTKLSG